MFVDRQAELSSLEDWRRRADRKSQFIVIYGRRRIGKTTLAREFLKGGRGAFVFVEPKSEELILKDCESSLAMVIGHAPRLDSWEALIDLAREEKLTLVFDEFQNLGVANPHIYARIQKIWDKTGSEPGLLLVAIGSYVGLIKKIFRDGKQPLFGRASSMMRLMPFDVFATAEFLGEMGMSVETALDTYAVFGGVPRYLEEFALGGGDVGKLFLDPTSSLQEEGVNVLTLEFGSQHKGYFSVLESLGRGKCTPKEIADYAGMNMPTVSKYLGELAEEYEMVSAEHPITVSNRKLVRYRIRDNFFDFWFRHIRSRSSLIHINPEQALADIREQLPAFIGMRMEGVVGELILSKRPVFAPTAIGRWWDRGGEEIDLVALDEKRSKILFVEVKWGRRKVGVDVAKNLTRKAGLVQWRNRDRREHFLVVSRKGFTDSCLKYMYENGMLHWDLGDMERMVLE